MLMHYFVCSEIGIANSLHRHFDWSANSLWYEEVPHAKDPSKSMFVLGGKDSIVNSDVRKYLTSAGEGLTYFLRSALPDTLNPMALRRACCILPTTPTVKPFSTALASLLRLWTGSKNTSDPTPPRLSDFGLLYPTLSSCSLPIVLSLSFPRGIHTECCIT